MCLLIKDMTLCCLTLAMFMGIGDGCYAQLAATVRVSVSVDGPLFEYSYAVANSNASDFGLYVAELRTHGAYVKTGILASQPSLPQLWSVVVGGEDSALLFKCDEPYATDPSFVIEPGTSKFISFRSPFAPGPATLGVEMLPLYVDPDLPTTLEVATLGPSRLPGDINDDGRVNLSDFVLLRSNFGRATDVDHGDIDASGRVDLRDFVILRTNFGRTAEFAVPEPNGGALLAVAWMGAWYMSRCRERCCGVDCCNGE